MILNKVVITGATGVIGSALVEYILEKNIEVYVVCRPDSKRIAMLPKHHRLHLIMCDLKNISKLPSLITEKCDAFFHLAWLGTDNPQNRFNMYIQSENIRYSLDVVNAAHELGCKVFIGAGSQAEYGHVAGVIHPYMAVNPISGYGMAKLCAGQMTRAMCKELGIRHIWPRILSVYGKNESKSTFVGYIIDSLISGGRPSLTKCEQVWDYVYSGDVANAMFKMAETGKDGAVYVVGSGKTKTLKEYAEIIRDEINPSLVLGFGDKEYYKDQAMHLEADISNLKEDTAWVPKTDFQLGIKKIIEYVRTNTDLRNRW